MDNIFEKCYVTNLWDLGYVIFQNVEKELFLDKDGYYDASLMWDKLIPWWNDKQGGIYWFTEPALKNALREFSDDERTVKIIAAILELMDKEELPKGFLCLV